jgi:uncharacterized membrane protein
MPRSQAILIAGFTALAAAPRLTAQPGFTLIPHLPGGWFTTAKAVSQDGVWIVGSGPSALATREAFRWSSATGTQSLGPHNGDYMSEAYDVSVNGSIVVGTASSGANLAAFRWTAATGKVSIGPSHAFGVSGDGSVAVGFNSTASRAFAWTQATGQILTGSRSGGVRAVSADGTLGAGYFQHPSEAFLWPIGADTIILGSLPGTTSDTQAHSISPDGAIVGGYGHAAVSQLAWVWTQQFGYTTLSSLPNRPRCNVFGISADGRIVVGECTNGSQWTAAIWTGPGPQGPYQASSLSNYLIQRGLTVPPGSTPYTATDITGDGTVIVGSVFTPNGEFGFRAQTCYANCDDSIAPGMLTVADFSCFLQRFAEASQRSHQHQLYHWANCDKSTTAPALNIADFSCFLQKFAAGCP